MAFGKRGVRQEPRTLPSTPIPEVTTPSPRSVYGPLGWMAIGAVGVFILIAGINALILLHLGRDFDDKWARPAGTKSITATFIGTDQFSRELKGRCNQPKFGFSLYQPAHLTDNQVELARKVRHANALTNYIECSMRTARHRFCAPQARSDLADQVRAYLRMRKDALRFARYAKSQPKTRHDRIMERLARNDNLERRVIIPDTTITQVDPRLIRGLQLLVQDGYFSQSDFGGFLWPTVPEELAPSLQVVTARHAPCGSS